MEEAATQEGVWKLFLVVRCNDDDGAVPGLDQLLGFVAEEFHAINFAKQIVGEFNVGLVNFVDQQHHRFVTFKCLPQHALHDVVRDVFNALFTQL